MFLGLLFGCGGDIVHHPPPGEDSATEGLAVLALDPAVGPAAGGTFVRVEGQGFTSGSTVTVGGAACAELTFLSSAELYCTTPPGAVGEVELVVTEGGDTATAPFTYLLDDPDTGVDTGEPPATITSCTLVSPTSMEVEQDDGSPAVIGSVVVEGRTEGEGQAPGIEGEVGFGRAADDPSLWFWTTMGYVSSADPADEYTGTFYPEELGSYAYTARFRVDHGEWTLCTAAGGGYGDLEVTPTTAEVEVDYCHVQWPCATTVAPGAPSETIYAWIYQGGVTQGDGQGERIQLDLGIGPDGTDPETATGWTWSSMVYNGDKDGLSAGDKANDEYAGSLLGPAAAGSYDYVARASADDGLTWTVCDLGGDSCNFGGSSDGYDDPGTCTVE